MYNGYEGLFESNDLIFIIDINNLKIIFSWPRPPRLHDSNPIQAIII